MRMVLQPMTPARYDLLVAGNGDAGDWLAEDSDESLDKSWTVLYHLLVNGDHGNPPLAAKAIAGDVLIADDELPHSPPFGEIPAVYTSPDGSRIEYSAPGLGALSAVLVREIARELAILTDEDVARRASRIPIHKVFRGIMPADEIWHYIHALQCCEASTPKPRAPVPQ